MSDSSLYDSIIPKVVEVVRGSSALAAKDTKFYASIDKDLRDKFEKSSSALLELANKLLNSKGTTLGYGEFEATSDGGWKKVSDCLDTIFEKIDVDLDHLKAPKKDSKFQSIDESKSFHTVSQVKIKPQNNFRIPVDNSDEHPFRPKLASKPHAITPFETTMVLQHDSDGSPFYNHPYEKEIAEFPYPESVLQISEPIPSLNWNETNATWVDSLQGLQEMIKDLEGSSEVAVDLEHHDLRSYYGITCLMQISNRERDWVVDTLILRDDLSILNTIFANPKVIKVFHGASMDIIWLQRDLGLYVVSLFDTYFASKSLGLQKFSLAFLLENFANFKTSKKFQLADWRVRPIPAVMMDYARADTHFLLNIYDLLRNKLVASGDSKLQEVLYQSRKVAARKFEYLKFRKNQPSNAKFSFNDGDTARYFMTHYNIPTSKEHFVANLFEWRDQTARKYDESPRFVMSNQTMVNICQIQHPATMQQLRSCFNGNIQIFSENSEALLKLVKDFVSKIDQQNSDLPKIDFEKEILSIDSAREVEELFNDFTEKQEGSSTLASSSGSLKDFSVLKNYFKTPMFSIQISDEKAKPKQVTMNDFKNRLKLRQTSLKSYTVDHFKQDVNFEQNSEVTEEQSESPSPPVEEEPSRDQFITLLKKEPKKKPLTTKQEESNSPNFDYESNEISILGATEKEANPKKRSFEPYNRGAVSGPKPFKSRKIRQTGKSASFIKKK